MKQIYFKAHSHQKKKGGGERRTIFEFDMMTNKKGDTLGIRKFNGIDFSF